MPSVIRGDDNFDTKKFVSSEQVITSAGSLTLPHGLGRSPIDVQLKLVCKTAEDGYAPGDEIFTGLAEFSSDLVDGFGISVVADNTNIYLRYGNVATNVFVALNKATGALVSLQNANWRLIIVAR